MKENNGTTFGNHRTIENLKDFDFQSLLRTFHSPALREKQSYACKSCQRVLLALLKLPQGGSTASPDNLLSSKPSVFSRSWCRYIPGGKKSSWRADRVREPWWAKGGQLFLSLWSVQAWQHTRLPEKLLIKWPHWVNRMIFFLRNTLKHYTSAYIVIEQGRKSMWYQIKAYDGFRYQVSWYIFVLYMVQGCTWSLFRSTGALWKACDVYHVPFKQVLWPLQENLTY